MHTKLKKQVAMLLALIMVLAPLSAFGSTALAEDESTAVIENIILADNPDPTTMDEPEGLADETFESIDKLLGSADWTPWSEDELLGSADEPLMVAASLAEECNAQVQASIKGGSLILNTKNGEDGAQSGTEITAVEGDVVTVTVTPDEGRQLSSGSLKYSADDGGSYTEIAENDGIYSFVMPAANVTVTADFEPLSVDGVYQLAAADDLLWFADYIKTHPDINAMLMADIDMSSYTWTAMSADYANAYSGIFDGNDKTVTINYTEASSTAHQGFGFFAVISGGTVKNLTVAGTITVTGNSMLRRSVGGIVGTLSGGTLENVTNRAVISDSGGTTGGVAGAVYAYDTLAIIANAKNFGSVSTSTTSSVPGLGGIVGDAGSENITIIGAENYGSVSAVYTTTSAVYVGGIIGNSRADISDCVNYGNVTVSGRFSGGIAGRAQMGSLTDNTNIGIITNTNATPYIGGVAANSMSGVTAFTGNKNQGVISTPAATNGMYIGAVIGNNQTEVTNLSGNAYVPGTADKGVGGSASMVESITDEHVTLYLPDGKPVVIKTSDPIKTDYMAGTRFAIDGFEALLIMSDGGGGFIQTIVAANDVDWDNKSALTLSDTEIVVTVYMTGMDEPAYIPVSINVFSVDTLISISVINKPDSTLYVEGEAFDKASVNVVATFAPSVTISLSAEDFTVIPDTFSAGDTKATVSYTFNGITKKADVLDIVVVPKDAPPVDAEGFYQLGTPAQLAWFATYVAAAPDARAVLVSDIDMTDKDWDGIGGYNLATAYTGAFNGGGHTVTLDINEPTLNNQGLFRYTNGAEINNLTIEGSVTGYGSVGGIVGYANDSTISNVVNNAVTKAIYGSVGGIAGNISGTTTITNAVNNGEVLCLEGNAGGIAGSIVSAESVISNSTNNGAIFNTFTQPVGGTAGVAGGITGRLTAGTLSDNTNNGTLTVNASTSTGGIAGEVGGEYSSAAVNAADNVNHGIMRLADGTTTSSNFGGVFGRVFVSSAAYSGFSGNLYDYALAANGVANSSNGRVPGKGIRPILPEGVTGLVVKTGDPTKGDYPLGINWNYYYTGEIFDMTGFSAAVQYRDGTEVPISTDNISHDAPVPLTSANRIVRVTVNPEIEGVEPVTFVYNFNVLGYYNTLTVTKLPSNAEFKTSYTVGEAFDRSTISVTANINNVVTDVAVSDLTITPETFKLGDTSVVISYNFGEGVTNAYTITGLTVTAADWSEPVPGDDGFYPLSTVEDMFWLAQQVAANQTVNARLTADVDLSAYAWVPIGTSARPFTGIFDAAKPDGGSYTITINVTGTSNLGLFGYVRGANIKNLIIDGTVAASNGYAAGVAANVLGATVIENVTNKAAISGSNAVAGIAAYVTPYASTPDAVCIVTNCKNEGEISSLSGAGGIVGQVTNSASISISGCENSGAVTGNGRPGTSGFVSSVGGILGFAAIGTGKTIPTITVAGSTNSGIVTNSATPSVSAAGMMSSWCTVGGILGMEVVGDIVLTDNTNTGSITGSSERYSYIGGIAGQVVNKSSVSGNTNSSGLDFGCDINYDSGKGIESDPFIITTAEQLDAIRTNIAGCFKLGGNINLTAFLEGTTNGWIPIACSGNVTSYLGFTGVLDGAGHKITGLWSDTSGSEISTGYSSGFFGFISGVIKNLNLVLDAKGFKGKGCLGALVGFLTGGGSIDNCSVTGEGSVISGSGGRAVGGIVGESAYPAGAQNQITNCINEVDVISVTGGTGGYGVGGIIGSIANGTLVENCVNNGNVTGNHGVGGIAGHMSGGNNFGSEIINSTNNGSVNAVIKESNNPDSKWSVGGIIGDLSTNYPVEISGNSNNGVVTGTSQVPNVGAIIGGLSQTSGGGSLVVADNEYREGTANNGVGGTNPQYNSKDSVTSVPAPEPPSPGEEDEQPVTPPDNPGVTDPGTGGGESDTGTAAPAGPAAQTVINEPRVPTSSFTPDETPAAAPAVQIDDPAPPLGNVEPETLPNRTSSNTSAPSASVPDVSVPSLIIAAEENITSTTVDRDEPEPVVPPANVNQPELNDEIVPEIVRETVGNNSMIIVIIIAAVVVVVAGGGALFIRRRKA